MTDASSSDLNYKGISIFYGISSFVATILFFFQRSESAPSFMTNLNDVYIVFMPYVPCFIWSLFALLGQRKVLKNTIKIPEKEM